MKAANAAHIGPTVRYGSPVTARSMAGTRKKNQKIVRISGMERNTFTYAATVMVTGRGPNSRPIASTVPRAMPAVMEAATKPPVVASPSTR